MSGAVDTVNLLHGFFTAVCKTMQKMGLEIRPSETARGGPQTCSGLHRLVTVALGHCPRLNHALAASCQWLAIQKNSTHSMSL